MATHGSVARTPTLRQRLTHEVARRRAEVKQARESVTRTMAWRTQVRQAAPLDKYLAKHAEAFERVTLNAYGRGLELEIVMKDRDNREPIRDFARTFGTKVERSTWSGMVWFTTWKAVTTVDTGETVETTNGGLEIAVKFYGTVSAGCKVVTRIVTREYAEETVVCGAGEPAAETDAA